MGTGKLYFRVGYLERLPSGRTHEDADKFFACLVVAADVPYIFLTRGVLSAFGVFIDVYCTYRYGLAAALLG